MSYKEARESKRPNNYGLNQFVAWNSLVAVLSNKELSIKFICKHEEWECNLPDYILKLDMIIIFMDPYANYA